MANARSKSPPGGAGDVSPTGNGSGSTATTKMRKRTKTGCLTCRKRRIKCGEERPTCANCIKSKRQCEGYNQRVVFKPPIGDWPNHPGVVSTIQYHTSMLPGTRNPQFQTPQSTGQAQEHAPAPLQPRPSGSFDISNMDADSTIAMSTASQVLVGGPNSYSPEQTYQQPLPSPHQQPLHSPHHLIQNPTPTTSYFPQPSPIHTTFQIPYSHGQDATFPDPQRYTQNQGLYQPTPASYDNFVDAKLATSQALPTQAVFQQQYPSPTQSEDYNAHIQHSNISPREDTIPHYAGQRPIMQRYNSHPHVAGHHPQLSPVGVSQAGYTFSSFSHADFTHSSYQSVQIPSHDMMADAKYLPQPVLEQPTAVSQTQTEESRLLLRGFAGDDHVSPSQVLDEAAIEYEDDDYWDVQSDDEMIDCDGGENTMVASKEFEIIRRIHFENSSELGIRRYDTFLYDGLLTRYKPEYAASPLRNPKAARVFAHFIHVTAVSISIYERNPRNSSLIFEGPTPPAQQGLWTYILPLKALNHQGLLHAMLALSSLHIARLQGASITPSYKHYAYSLKRLGRSLGNPKKRLSIPTLATALLLAFYEVWTAEHTKWSTHLVGAAQLLTELDFRSLTREARRLKAAQMAEERQFPYQNPEMLIDQHQFNENIRERDLKPDENLVSAIIGKQVSYDDFGMIVEDNGARQDAKTRLLGDFDMRSFETLQDLYWWYCRHDMWQSCVSGNPLITHYRKWSDCPPRAPLGRADALYGSHDHIVLLIGRIADFTCRDRERKLRQAKADGGQWRPRPGMPGEPPAGMSRSQPSTPGVGPPSQMKGPPPGWTGGPPPGWKGPPTPRESPPSGPPPAMPNFYGMTPARPHAPITTRYANPDYKRSPPTPHVPLPEYADLPSAYESAINEWDNINAAHTTIAQVLSSTKSFAPLPPELQVIPPGETSTMTPFGPALVHRSYDISVLWALLYLSKIILLRAHPTMPPAMMMAVGVCAQATGPYATLIGRITAGMQLPMGEDLSPFLGSVLQESTMSLFFAGVQYQDPAQREWTVTRLLEIDRRTGWASAGIIARGVETSWEKAAQMGRGPPYKRRTRRVGEEGPLVLEEEGASPPNWRHKEENNAMGKGARMEEVVDERGLDERRFLVKPRMVTWAKNVFGTEEDLQAGMERVGL
ncbi:hypothetical protein BU25DRAFT_99806 [Macroventuria anomochaeta]|uniref:Uncharacterized protein n=1 Tax=Macroventuria anomochaeta TaxID=301207 RepID=A0ACB6S005_9PLEO|nr:uncharacterized protein BU25DRAFT_99806 [Macroventuria anomochaeta]KAF2626467.1 hypothetical protein BU25DRAFT_99806 [Macroventuria anomochaeta]